MSVAHNDAKEIWNERHLHHDRDEIINDDWLDTFKDIIDKCQTPIIDLGCGCGNDTLYLIERNKAVIPYNYSENAIKNMKKNFPEVVESIILSLTHRIPSDLRS